MYPENLKGTQVIVGFINMGYDIYLSLYYRTQTRNLFHHRRMPIP